MKNFILALLLFLLSSSFAAYEIGEKVRSEDNLSWTDSEGYSTTLFDEIFVNKNVVVLSYGGAG